jgi:hypothetical protein
MSCYKSAEQNHDIKVANASFDNVEKFKHLEKNYRIKIVFIYLFQNVFVFRLLYKSIDQHVKN